MELLFKRDQTIGKLARVQFKLWGKIELNEEEQELLKRYRFDDAVMIAVLQPNLLRNSALIALGVFLASLPIFSNLLGYTFGPTLCVVLGGAAGYWFFNEKRETIFVKDLLHGRYFSCDSVVELARKEAWLETVVSYLRQVMESAKHWEGTQRHTVEPLPKDEARRVILKGL